MLSLRTSSRRARTTGLLLFFGALLAPGSSLPCSPSRPSARRFLSPSDGARNVPLNAKVWLGGVAVPHRDFRRSVITLEDQNGERVAGVERVILGFGKPPPVGPRHREAPVIGVFLPDQDLAPDSTYRIKVLDELLGVFHTGTMRDQKPPKVPGVKEVRHKVRALALAPAMPCGAENEIEISLDTDGTLVVVDRPSSAGLNVKELWGYVGDWGDSTLFLSQREEEFPPWPEVKPGASVQVRFGAFDVAGNFSG